MTVAEIPPRIRAQEPIPDLPGRTVTIWQGNARYRIGGAGETVYEFSLSTRGASLGTLENIVIETDHGRIEVPGPMDGTPEGGYVKAELATDEYVESFMIKSATATVNGQQGMDILPFMYVHEYQPMPVLLPGDPESFLDSVKYYEMHKFVVDAPIDFGDAFENPPLLYISDFVEAAVQIYLESQVSLLVFNEATLLARPVEGPYVVLHNRDGINGFSVMLPGAGDFRDDVAAFSFKCRVGVDPVNGPVAADPEVTVNGERQDIGYAARYNPIVMRAFTFG
ncbi:MAG: hypothetical protein LBW85_00195 [Deltaproteobacteria bacterium]|jgi:hypothetical protein|nr:hypothetical protein [Deltaproteobacteria bacterium]